MKLPSKPKRIADMGDFCRDVINWMRANEIHNVAGGLIKKSPNGVTIEVQPRAKQRPGLQLPFTVSKALDGETVSLSVLGGAWQEGATGEWEIVPPTPAEEGVYAYFVIEQDEDRAITGCSISIQAEALEPIVIDEYSDASTSNVLLAELDEEGELVQRRHGNFTLGIWQIDGDVVRWPETVVGTIPTPPEEETPP
jgi:hypothetical protein